MWQEWLDSKGDAAPAFLSIAVDVQGPALPGRYVEEFGVRYPVVVDRANVVAGSLLGQRVVPLWTVLDEEGRLVASGAGGAKAVAEVEKHLAATTKLTGRAATREPTLQELDAMAAAAPKDVAIRLEFAMRVAAGGKRMKHALAILDATGFDGMEAKAIHMARADVLLRTGEKAEALESLRAALALDPKDYLVRKQIWCIEAPQKFYEGGVDYRWQGERMRADREAESDSSSRK